LNIFKAIVETYNLAEEYNYDWKNDVIKTLYRIFTS
jgi:hypothetical protein